MPVTKSLEELQTVVDAWVNDEFQHLLITGIPGSGKTTAVTKTGAHVIESSSAFELYKQIAYAANAGYDKILLDDLSTDLYRRGRGANLVKQILNPETPRTISWKSSHTGRGKVPSSVELKAKVCVITNHLGSSNEHLKAIMERCFVVEHLPSGESVLEFAQKENIVPKKFVEAIKAKAPSPRYLSLRRVKRLHTAKKLSMDWEKEYEEYLKEMSGL